MRQRVPLGIRVVNVLALLLFLAGAGFYLRAWLGMRRLETHGVGGGGSALERFDQLVRLSSIGVWLVVAAVGVAVLAASATAVIRRRRSPEEGPPLA